MSVEVLRLDHLGKSVRNHSSLLLAVKYTVCFGGHISRGNQAMWPSQTTTPTLKPPFIRTKYTSAKSPLSGPVEVPNSQQT